MAEICLDCGASSAGPDYSSGKREELCQSHAPWIAEVLVEGKWAGNALRFRTSEAAIRYGRDLLSRWFVPTDHRAVNTITKEITPS
jgi:hypothetical protein